MSTTPLQRSPLAATAIPVLQGPAAASRPPGNIAQPTANPRGAGNGAPGQPRLASGATPPRGSLVNILA